jgi:hypothetical protein
VGDSNPQSDDSNIDEGWDDEPDADRGAPESASQRAVPTEAPSAPTAPTTVPVPRPGVTAPSAAATSANAWGPVPATTRPPASSGPPRVSGPPLAARIAAPATSSPRSVEASRPTAPAGPIEPKKAGAIAPAQKTKFGRGTKDTRAAKAAKKAAKKAARQAERKARAKNNNKAAQRAAALAATKGHEASTTLASTTARVDAQKRARRPVPEAGRSSGGSQRDAKSSTAPRARFIGGVRAVSTTLLVLVAAVLVLAALGWFLASRH